MKQLLAALAFFIFTTHSLAQQKPYNVVFDLTTKDSVSQQAVIRWLKEISSSNPSANLEVVMYGQGLDLVTKGKSLVESDVAELARNKNIKFSVCAIAMKNHNLQADQLVPGVMTVPDGIYEIISKQGEGWGYIKVTR